MAINARDLLNFVDAKLVIATNESEFRVLTSSAYYSAYHHVLISLNITSYCGHKRLEKKIKNSALNGKSTEELQALASLYSMIRKKRVDADYKLKLNIKKQDVETQVAHVKQILKKL